MQSINSGEGFDLFLTDFGCFGVWGVLGCRGLHNTRKHFSSEGEATPQLSKALCFAAISSGEAAEA
eukprot:2432286-Amphidinium_carterae.1